ncbi:MAG: OmpA family protein [Ignavibacteriaceae bacterium]|nr:OmpA family protein [Ignavibacteriaceae bacterium]
MKNKSTILILILLGFLLSANLTMAQFNDYDVKLGLQFNGLLPDTEFDKDLSPNDAEFKFSFLGRAFLRFQLITEVVEAEIGGGFGRLTGEYEDANNNNFNWWTYIIPFDARIILSPFDLDGFNPYAYGGAGYMHFSNDKKPTQVPMQANLSTEESGWAAIFPVGGGFEVVLSDVLLLDFSGGYTFTLSDDLNGYTNIDDPSTDQNYDGYYNAAIGLTFVSGYGGSDNDKDGLIKRVELEIGTDPDNPDTDGDGLKDGEEVNTYKTDPLNGDSDADKLKDGEEVNNYKTDPLNADTDGDTLEDGNELTMFRTDPLDADTDNDTLDDGKEVNEFKTDPLKGDTDDDSLLDGDEINSYKTNPLNADTDTDGLRDGEEINKFTTDPLNPDTDGGTVDDLTELNRGTDPLDPEDDVVKIDVPIVLEGITFETGKSDITPESAVVLQAALKTLKTYQDIIVEISGHTDNVGSNSSNQSLSQRRADSVRFWLISNGVDPDRIIAKGYGEEFPRVPNDTPDNKRMNRRIEFKRIR